MKHYFTTRIGMRELWSIPFDMLPKNSDFGDPAPLAPITMMSNLPDFARFAIVLTVSVDVTIFFFKIYSMSSSTGFGIGHEFPCIFQ